MEGFVDSYLIDLEVLFGSIFVDVNVALINLRSLESHEISKDMSASARELVKKLYLLIQKFAFSLQKYPQTFLQNVVNEGGEQLSSKASDLLRTRYRDIFYLLDEHDRQNDAIEARWHLSGKLLSIDVSPNHDYVVCGYEKGEIELFSLATGMSEWKNEVFVVPSPIPCIFTLPHQVVFHPHENLILPGRLDKVLTLQGKFTAGPFHCDNNISDLVIVVLPWMGPEWSQITIMVCLFGMFIMAEGKGLSHVIRSVLYLLLPVAIFWPPLIFTMFSRSTI